MIRRTIFSLVFILFAAAGLPSGYSAQAAQIPTTWQVNGNGYTGILVLNRIDAATSEVSGTLLGTPVRGYLVGRHLVLHRYPQGRTQIWDGWILDPKLGAHGQPYYNGTLIIAGLISEDKSPVDGVYPWYAVAQAVKPAPPPPQPPSSPRVNLAGNWDMTCIGKIVYRFQLRLNQSGDHFTGDMVRTNGTEPHTRVDGRVQPDGTLHFLRTTGSWRQHYIGRVIERSGNRAIRLEGKFGDEGDEKLEWNARRSD
jgi:hypothetical protein